MFEATGVDVSAGQHSPTVGAIKIAQDNGHDPSGGGMAERDLGSSNGTAVNGEALTPGEPRVLLEDDVICFGAWRGKNASDVRYRLSRASASE